MAPFWSGIAIGIVIGVPIFLLCVVAGVAIALYRGISTGIRSGEFARAWREAQAPGSRADRLKAAIDARTERLWQSRERQLAWMQNHFGFRTLARLNRRLCG